MESHSRRQFIRGLGIGLGVIALGSGSWVLGDPYGEMSAETPPFDRDGDGLFEDVNGDGELTYEDVLMFSHEGVWEEITGEDFGHAFDYASDGDWAANLQALAAYIAQEQHTGLWDYAGKPLDLTFHRTPPVKETTAEHAALQAESALNNAALRTDADWYADIDVTTADGVSPPYSSLQTLVDDFGDYLRAEQTGGGTYNVLLVGKGQPGVWPYPDGNPTPEEWDQGYSVITGLDERQPVTGNPLFTRDFSTVLPVRGAGIALGMETHVRSRAAPADEIGTITDFIAPMNTNTIEEKLEFIRSEVNNSSGTVPVTDMSYVTLYYDRALESVSIGDLVTRSNQQSFHHR